MSTTPSTGKLKLKMFSKMKEKNTIEGATLSPISSSDLGAPSTAAVAPSATAAAAASPGGSSGDRSPPPLSIDEAKSDSQPHPEVRAKHNSLPNVVPLQV